MTREKTSVFRSLALSAAVAGLLAGSASLTGCGGEGDTSDNKSTERNGCSGPNGCGGSSEEKKSHDKNGCSGPNGCGGKKGSEEERK